MSVKPEQFADFYQPDFGCPWVDVLPLHRAPGMPPTQRVLSEMSLDELLLYEKTRKDRDIAAELNPVGSGWTLPSWQMVMENWNKYNIHVLLGGNQSAKTTFGSRLAVWAAGTIPGAEVYCWHVTDKRSIDDQQRFVYEALPQSIKTLPTKKGTHHSVQYTQKNGFTDGICILPPLPGCRRGGSIKFFNYAQYQQNDQIIEGVKAHFCWADEVIPVQLMETMKYRLLTYHGRMLLTFTVIDGWNDTIQKILAKTRTIKKRYSERMKAELPVMQESLSMDSCCIYYAWTEDNPFTSMDQFWKLNASADRATVLARGYGIPSKSIQNVFPAFDREVNVVPHEELPFIKDPEYPCTRYMAIDPAGSKNWFMVWVAIDAAGTWWIYREWPDYDDWALPGSTAEGKPGPAQKGTRKGIKDYVELIRNMEGGEEIYERIIDPRLGNAQRQAEEGATTLISDLEDHNMIVLPAPGGAGGAGGEIEDGLQLINNLLAWDQSKPRDSANSPHLFVSDRCQNVIYALQEYTAKGGRDENTKDPIDCLRYLRKANCDFLGDLKPDFSPTGCY